MLKAKAETEAAADAVGSSAKKQAAAEISAESKSKS